MRTFSGEELRRSKQVAVVFSPLVGGKISAIFDRQVQAPKGVFTDTPPPQCTVHVFLPLVGPKILARTITQRGRSAQWEQGLLGLQVFVRLKPSEWQGANNAACTVVVA